MFAFQRRHQTGKCDCLKDRSLSTARCEVGTLVPLHNELKIGTLRSVLKLAKIDPEDFARYL